jgi:hypothetical protein
MQVELFSVDSVAFFHVGFDIASLLEIKDTIGLSH